MKSQTYASIFLGIFLFQTSFIHGEVVKLADENFAKLLCEKWNESVLPRKLGTKKSGGTGWIDHITSKRVPEKQQQGYQKIVMGRFDCSPEWNKIEIVIEQQNDGSAKCTSAGAYDGKRVTWQIVPKTKDYFKYQGGFEVSLWKLDSKGDYDTKLENKDNFITFFHLVADLALESDYFTGCEGIKEKDVIQAKSGYLKLTKPDERRTMHSEFKLADEVFAQKLCNSWNHSRLPDLLASENAGGNGWVDSVVKHNVPEWQPSGYQKIVSGRSDCKPKWPEFELVIERSNQGKAVCTSAGKYTGKRVTWFFLPGTNEWFYFKNGFALSLWRSNTIGDFIVSMKNYSNFEIFFNLAAELALKSDYLNGCGEMDIEKVEIARNSLLEQRKNPKMQ